jgi:hypothetical protein
MSIRQRLLHAGILLLGLGFVWACPFDVSLREYLSGSFWLPFAKHPPSFEKPHVRRINAPFAGMTKSQGDSPLARLRAAYQQLSHPPLYEQAPPYDVTELRRAISASRADASLASREKEEVELLDAKIDLRAAPDDDDQLLLSAKKKLIAFLKTARTPEFRSEARGWLGHIEYRLGNQTAAGKIYLDELNRSGSNLGRETLLNSLRMNYGYDGGQELLDHLDEYFDTPEHAAFAIQLVTNPHWPGNDHQSFFWNDRYSRFQRDRSLQFYPRIKVLLEKHAGLLASNTGASALALLTMRTALRMGDPRGAAEIGEKVPASAAMRMEPDFNWMLASAHFLGRQYSAAEQPLLTLFWSARSSIDQKAAAAYGLCGVYRKTGKVAEQIRFALWLYTHGRESASWGMVPAGIDDLSIYWASSGWDLGLLLDAEAPMDALASFGNEHPALPNIRLVKYSLAVRLARENRYAEAADLYQSIHAVPRARRMGQLARLYAAANSPEAKYKLAEFISANTDRIYFNDALWQGYQRYALQASGDSRLTRSERQQLLGIERKLKDDQEERWRAYLILSEIVRDSGDAALRRKAALLGMTCLRAISDRFGREEEIRKADIVLWRSLRRSSRTGTSN